MTFLVLDLELRSDAIRVQVHVQRQENGVWVDSGTDSALGGKLEELVLTRAREIRAAGVNETEN
jgi:phage gp46-like protein